jgi:hypothetical protein
MGEVNWGRVFVLNVLISAATLAVAGVALERASRADRLERLEQRIAQLESNSRSVDFRFERCENRVNDIDVQINVTRWWCRPDGVDCVRSHETCGKDCVPHRIAYCGGEGFSDCFVEGVQCARHNFALASAAKKTETACLGVE